MTLRATALGIALSLSALLAVSAQAAVTITNRDDKEQKITVIENNGAKKTDHVMKPNQVLEGICAAGCVIRLNDSEEDEYELDGKEVVSIEEGFLYYDGPETPAETPTPGAAPAPAPGAAPEKPPAKQ